MLFKNNRIKPFFYTFTPTLFLFKKVVYFNLINYHIIMLVILISFKCNLIFSLYTSVSFYKPTLPLFNLLIIQQSENKAVQLEKKIGVFSVTEDDWLNYHYILFK